MKRTVLLLGLVLACRGGVEAPPQAAPGVTVASVAVRPLEERIEANGELRAKDSASIAAEVAGRVTETPHEEGSRVSAGTVVMRIDPERHALEESAAAARLAETEANLVEQERALVRIRELRAGKVASEERLDQAETATKLARARVEAARAQLSMARRAHDDASVTAPFDGLVARRFVSVGEFVQPGKALFELVALDPIEVEFHLTERDVSRVRPGVPVEVQVAPYPGERFQAEVTVISPTVDPATRTLRVRAEMANGDGRLRPGLFARADLGVSRREAVAMIPEEAVLQRADGAVVFRFVPPDRVERRLVAIGAHDGGRVEVVQGLSAEDQVVTKGHATLVDGAVVEVRSRDGTAVGETSP